MDSPTQIAEHSAMKVNGAHTRTIWLNDDGWSVEVIDQTCLPHRLSTLRLANVEDAARAIATMIVRGAPLIGATAAYGMALAMREMTGIVIGNSDGGARDLGRLFLPGLEQHLGEVTGLSTQGL